MAPPVFVVGRQAERLGISELVELEPAVEGFAPGSAGVAWIVGAEGTGAVIVEVHLGIGSRAFPIKVERDQAGGYVVMITSGGDEEFGCILRNINIYQ